MLLLEAIASCAKDAVAVLLNNLVCVTDNIKYNIDHICVSPDWARQVNQVNTWQGFTPDGKPVSDHQGVYVDLFCD